MTSPFRRAEPHSDSAGITNDGDDASECLSRD
jgi:hypothetical protein